MQIIDITIPLSESTPVWEGEEGVTIQQSAVIDDESDYNVSRCELGLHSGTHVDAPFHVKQAGLTADKIPIEKMIGDVQVLKIPEKVRIIDRQLLKRMDINRSINKVIFKTDNSKFWKNNRLEFSRDYTGIDSSGADFLLALEIELVGIDYFSISVFHDLLRPHQTLLKNNVVLLENLDLRAAAPGIYQLICLPLKIIGTDGAPARVILMSDQ